MSTRPAACVVALALLGSAGCAGRNVITIPAPPKPEHVAEQPAAAPGYVPGPAGDETTRDSAPTVHGMPGAPAPEALPTPPVDAPDAVPAGDEAAPSGDMPEPRPPVQAAPDAPPPAAGADDPGDEELHPVLLDGTTERLRVQTLRELDEAQKRIDELEARELDEDASLQLELATQFVTTARAALAKGDVHRAANLSRKAAVLLDDLE